MKTNKGFLRTQKGSTLTEYAVILGLIALVGWGAISALGTNAASIFNFIGKGVVDTSTAGTTGLAGAAKFGS